MTSKCSHWGFQSRTSKCSHWGFQGRAYIVTKISKLPYEEVQQVSIRLLSLVEKISHSKYKPLIPPKLVAKKIAFIIQVKIVLFGRQVAVCVKKRHKNAIFGCSRIQKFNFDCLLHKLINGSSKTENIFNFPCLLWTKSSIMISGTQIYFTLFLASSHKS